MTKLFITGATGYIGGDALYNIVKAHPEYDITCMVRSTEKGAKLAAQYAKVRLVYGHLDSYDLLKEESANADIVCNFANCDHEVAAKAIIEGLAQHTSEKPGYLIHTSGTGILSVGDLLAKRYGEADSKVYDDWDNVEEVTNIRDEAWHRNVDKVVLAGSTFDSIKTAIVCPPTIYGPGRGPVNNTSDQWPHMVEAALQRGKGFQVGKGENKWTYVHVQDLSDLYLLLVEAAAGNNGGPATWDDQGYYFVEGGEYVWGDMAKAITEEVHKQGLIQTAEVEQISNVQADDLTPSGTAKWGYNSRARAIRARKVLGWQPTHPTPEQEMEGLVKSEATKLGFIKGHAAVAAGEA